MAINAQLLEDSFALVSLNSEKLVGRFYELLFARYPELAFLFAGARMDDQHRMFLRSLALVVHKINNPRYLTDYLHGLGKSHVAYGALPAHYDAVGECLIMALADTAGKDWNPTVESTWVEAYAVIKKLMLEGARM